MAMPTAGAPRLKAVFDSIGISVEILEMPHSTRTAGEAAQAIGCTVAQIAKSILFRGACTGKPVLVVASGVNRVNERRIEVVAREPLEKANADFVRSTTGYAIGGVPPVGFPNPIETWIDRDLLLHSAVWAAAGTPFSVFRLDPQLLPKVTGGRVIEVL